MRLLQVIFLQSILMLSISKGYSANLLEDVTGHNINHSDFFQENQLYLGGWLSAGASYSTENPDDGNNTPITFNDRSTEFQLNQFNVYIQKLVDMESDSWEFGGRLDVLFGTDARFTQVTGLDDELISEKNLRFYDLSLPQAYLEVFIPTGNGLTAKIGHFYTIIGYEVVNAPDNFFYSHAYTMQYAEPFSHTGLLLNYPLNNNFTLNLGVVNGWDNFDDNLSNWNFLGSIAWSNDEETSSVVLSLISGDVDDVTSENRTMYSLVATHHFNDKLHYVFQHDFGFQEQADANGKDAYWYGLNQYFFYDYSDTVAVGLRAEWFRDDGDSRLNVGSSASYFAVSAGLNWSPLSWLKLRPEIRYDWADSKTDVFDQQTEDDQLMFAMDIVIEL